MHCAMAKKNHHYVPQFYLRFFSSDRNLVERPKRIHLFNIKGNLIKENVSIKDQCYKRKFYGDTEEVENILSEAESAYSWLLTQIIKYEKLPPHNTPEYQLLLDFVIVQHLRSKRHVNLQEDAWDGLMKSFLRESIDHMNAEQWENVLGKGATPITKEELDNYKIGFENPAVFSLSFDSDTLHYAISDLGMHLVLTRGNSCFITSDNPVVLYNQYFQGMKDMSFTGFVNTGLQIFLPLSPRCLLVLYDKNIYRIDNTSEATHGISPVDLRFVNLLQFVNADQNVFFNNLAQVPDLQKTYLFAKRFRKDERAKTLIFDAEKSRVNEVGSMLLQSFVEDLDVRLNLQFLELKRSVKKVPLRERLLKRFRKEMPAEYMPKFADPPDVPKRFVRRKSDR